MEYRAGISPRRDPFVKHTRGSGEAARCHGSCRIPLILAGTTKRWLQSGRRTTTGVRGEYRCPCTAVSGISSRTRRSTRPGSPSRISSPIPRPRSSVSWPTRPGTGTTFCATARWGRPRTVGRCPSTSRTRTTRAGSAARCTTMGMQSPTPSRSSRRTSTSSTRWSVPIRCAGDCSAGQWSFSTTCTSAAGAWNSRDCRCTRRRPSPVKAATGLWMLPTSCGAQPKFVSTCSPTPTTTTISWASSRTA